MLLPSSRHSPSGRFRVMQYVEPLRKCGYLVKVRVTFPDRNTTIDIVPWMSNIINQRINSFLRVISAIWMLRDAKKFDYIISNRDIVPELGVKFLEKTLTRIGCNYIFDFDDAIHLGARANKLDLFLSRCYFIIPGNKYLEDFAKQYSKNVQIIPTVVNTDIYLPSKFREIGKLRIGWSGSSSTNIHCLPILKPILECLSIEIDFEFIVISNENPLIKWENVVTKFVKWNPETEVQDLQLIDIGLMPLNDMPFEKGKCGLKAIQYMAIGIPALVSPVGINNKIVKSGYNGFHCNNDDEWKINIKRLLIDSDLRKKMGENARETVVNNYSLKEGLKLWLKILN